MVQSLDASHDATTSSGQDGYVGATLAMPSPAKETPRLSADVARPGQLDAASAVHAPAVEHAVTVDEPSIEEYMAALMARTRQYSTNSASDTQSLARAAGGPATLPPRPEPESDASSTSARSSFTPVPAPECRNSMSEWRELANISAQSSFNTHFARHLVLEMHGKRFVAIVAMFASVVLLLLASSTRSPAYLAAVVAVIAAIVFILKYLSLGRELAQVCENASAAGRAAE